MSNFMPTIKTQAKEKPAKHDELHKEGNCGCMNKCCWYQWWHTRPDGGKILLGICICPDCVCKSPRFAVLRRA